MDTLDLRLGPFSLQIEPSYDSLALGNALLTNSFSDYKKILTLADQSTSWGVQINTGFYNNREYGLSPEVFIMDPSGGSHNIFQLPHDNTHIRSGTWKPL